MQHAINIFGYGLTQFFTNLGSAFRLTGLVWIIGSALIYAIGLAMVGQPIGPMSLRPDVEGEMPALSASFAMVGVVINLLIYGYVAMVWARFCLGRDIPKGYVPSVKGQPFGGVMITLILVLAAVGAVAFLLSLLGSLLQPYMPLPVGLFGYPLLMVLVLILLFLRLGAAIPASADDKMISLTGAWNGSRKMGLLLVAVLAFMTLVILTLPAVLLSGLIIPGNLASVIGSWVMLLVGTGWLTAIYERSSEVSV